MGLLSPFPRISLQFVVTFRGRVGESGSSYAFEHFEDVSTGSTRVGTTEGLISKEARMVFAYQSGIGSATPGRSGTLLSRRRAWRSCCSVVGFGLLQSVDACQKLRPHFLTPKLVGFRGIFGLLSSHLPPVLLETKRPLFHADPNLHLKFSLRREEVPFPVLSSMVLRLHEMSRCQEQQIGAALFRCHLHRHSSLHCMARPSRGYDAISFNASPPSCPSRHPSFAPPLGSQISRAARAQCNLAGNKVPF